jgi:hypothetical protein
MQTIWLSLGMIPLALLAGCSAFQASDVGGAKNAPRQGPANIAADNSVIAEKIGSAPAGVFTPIPWANPGTGSAGVIESISTDGGLNDGCRAFITSRQRLDKTDRVRGVACQNDPKHWTIDILG